MPVRERGVHGEIKRLNEQREEFFYNLRWKNLLCLFKKSTPPVSNDFVIIMLFVTLSRVKYFYNIISSKIFSRLNESRIFVENINF